MGNGAPRACGSVGALEGVVSELLTVDAPGGATEVCVPVEAWRRR